MYRSMWEHSMDEMMSRLMNVSVGGLLYVGLIQQNTMFMPRLEHLTCYLPGNLALGVAYGAVNGSKADQYMEVAKNLTYSCWQMYERMPVGMTCSKAAAGISASLLHLRSQAVDVHWCFCCWCPVKLPLCCALQLL